jgi:two-component system, NtrC family, sensor histidine kinase KinB
MLGLRHKLSLGFGGLLLIIMIGGSQSIIQFKELGQSIDVILRENYRSVVACQEMKEALERIDSGILFTLLGDRQEGSELIGKYKIAFDRALGVERYNITLPGEKEKVDALEAHYAAYLKALSRIEHQPLGMDTRRRLYHETILPLFQQVKGEADAILQMNQENMNWANDRARKQAAGAQRRMYIFLLFGTLIAVAFTLLTGRWILRPLQHLMRSTEAIRDGNLDLVIPAGSRDEIGRLSLAFNDMAGSLREMRRLEQAKLVRTQEAARETFSRLPDAVAILDLDGKVEISTMSAKNLFGLKPGIRVQENPVLHLSRLFQNIVEEGAAKNQEEQKLFQFFIQGEERFFHADAAPMADREGRLTGVILVLKDITDRRQAEEIKGGLISMVSHQLKTPLTSVRMAIHLLLEEKVGPLAPKQVELLLAAREDTDLLHRILSKLLDIGRIESGRIQMEFHPVSPHTLAMDTVEPFRRSAQEGGIEMEINIPHDLPDVSVDMGQINHVFSNLLSNALRYTTPGGRIIMTAVLENPMIRFFVTDTGSGIPHQFLQRIFEQFYRVPDQKSETGTGLGLAIAKEIVEAHGGNINVESQEGRGTTFSFTLRQSGTD